MPKLSVILPVHNGAKYLAIAMESILAQTLADFELLCIDDGSTDTSAETLRDFAAGDNRIQVIERAHRGLIATLNEGLELARAPLVARMDCDDISVPERFEIQHDRMSRDPDLWVLGTAEVWIDEHGREISRPKGVFGKKEVARALEEKCVVSHPSVMMRTYTIRKLGGYRRAYAFAEDYDLWLRVSEVAAIDNVDSVGIRYRVHGESLSERHKIQQRVSDALARATHGLRVAGKRDPTDEMQDVPDLWGDPLLDELIPEEARFFRLIDSVFGRKEKAALALDLLDQDKRLTTKFEKLWQQTILRFVRKRGKVDGEAIRLLYAAFLIHPGRFLREFVHWG